MADASAAVASGKRGPKIADKDYNEGHEPRDGLNPGEYVFAFTNGKEIRGNIGQFPEHIVRQLAFHGLMQRGGDSYASVKGDADKGFENCERVITQLMQGEWGATREGGGGGSALWMLAMARLKKWFLNDAGEPTDDEAFKHRPDLGRVRKRIEELENEPDGETTIEKIKKSGPVKGEVLQIQAERAAEALAKSKATAVTEGADALATF